MQSTAFIEAIKRYLITALIFFHGATIVSSLLAHQMCSNTHAPAHIYGRNTSGLLSVAHVSPLSINFN